MLEAEVSLVTKVVWCVCLLHDDYVFDADTVVTIGIIAGLCKGRKTQSMETSSVSRTAS